MGMPAFENLVIDFWVDPRRVGFNQPTLCLYHQTLDIGAPILQALHELQAEIHPCKRTLTFTTCSRKRPIQKLCLKAAETRDELRVMNIRIDGTVSTIEMTDVGLTLMIDAVVAWLKGAEDFGVSPTRSTLKPKEFGKLDRDSKELWFWGPGYTGP